MSPPLEVSRTDNCGHQWERVENGMPWAYTDFYSYSHEWMLLPGTPCRMILCAAKGSPFFWPRERRDPQGMILLSDDGAENWWVATVEENFKPMPWMPWVLVTIQLTKRWCSQVWEINIGASDSTRKREEVAAFT